MYMRIPGYSANDVGLTVNVMVFVSMVVIAEVALV